MLSDEDPRHEGCAPLLPAAVLVPLLLALLAWSLLLPAQAAERRGRLTIELQLDGSSRWQDGGDESRSTLKRRYRIVTWLQPVGEPMEVNTKAPDYAQTMMARANQVQSGVAQAQARLVKHASTAAPQDDGEDLRFQTFQGMDRCGASVEVQVDETVEGRYADVQSPVAWRVVRHGAQPPSADEMRLICLGHSLVLDRRSGAITTDAGFGLPEPMVSSVHTERGRSEGSVKATLSWRFEEP